MSVECLLRRSSTGLRRVPPGDVVGKLQKCLYGTRDASKGWQAKVHAVMTGLGYAIGRYSPCLTYHRDSGTVNLFHGDDLVFAGPAESIHEVLRGLAEHFQLTTTVVGWR